MPINQLALDTAFPYGMNLVNDLGKKGTAQDSPEVLVPTKIPQVTGADVQTVARDDVFVTWIMYRPPSNGYRTTWIPIQQYSWTWGGTAQRKTILGNDVFQLIRPALSFQTPRPTRTAPTNTDAFPSWSFLFTNTYNTWVSYNNPFGGSGNGGGR
jgi:hypothetical protein